MVIITKKAGFWDVPDYRMSIVLSLDTKLITLEITINIITDNILLKIHITNLKTIFQ